MIVRGATKFREVLGSRLDNSQRRSRSDRPRCKPGRGPLPEPRAGGAARFPSK